MPRPTCFAKQFHAAQPPTISFAQTFSFLYQILFFFGKIWPEFVGQFTESGSAVSALVCIKKNVK